MTEVIILCSNSKSAVAHHCRPNKKCSIHQQDGQVVKALDLSFNEHMSLWVQTPLLVNSVGYMCKWNFNLMANIIHFYGRNEMLQKKIFWHHDHHILKISPPLNWPVDDAAHVDLQAAVVSQLLPLHLDQVHTLAVHSDETHAALKDVEGVPALWPAVIFGRAAWGGGEKAERKSASPTFLWNYADRFSRLRNLSHVTHMKTDSVAVAFEREAKLRLQVTYRWHRLEASNSSVSRQLSFKTVWIYTKSHSNLCFLEDFCWLSASICY